MQDEENQGWQVFAGWWKKTVFTMKKTVLAKIVFGRQKNTFCHVFFLPDFLWPHKSLYVCLFVFSFLLRDQRCSKPHAKIQKSSRAKPPVSTPWEGRIYLLRRGGSVQSWEGRGGINPNPQQAFTSQLEAMMLNDYTMIYSIFITFQKHNLHF